MRFPVRRIGLLLLALYLALLPALNSYAQGGIVLKLDAVTVSDFPEMNAFATVIDENGLPVTGLTADRFEIVEDGQSSFPPDLAEEIVSDEAQVSVLLLIDLGSTMKGAPLQAAKDAAGRFLEKLLNESGDKDQAAFIGFGSNVDITASGFGDVKREVPFTNDRGQLMNVINFVEVEGNQGTPLYDAIYRAIKISANQPGRRAIIVMTDGKDVGSTLKDSDPINEAQRQRIPIFPIGLSNSRLDRAYLTRLAELTGGQFQEAPQPDALAAKFEEVLSRIKVQYRLTYQSRLPKEDGQYHSLLLRVNSARGQGFDEMKFQLGQQPVGAGTPTPTAKPTELVLTKVTATTTTEPTAVSTAKPTALATATPVNSGGTVEKVTDWVSQNTMLTVIIVGALFLTFVLIILIVVLMRRRAAARRTAQPSAYGGEAYAPPAQQQQPAWQGQQPMVSTSAPTFAPGSNEPPSVGAETIAGGDLATGGTTQVAPSGPMMTPPPFTSQPGAFGGQPSSFGQPSAGQTPPFSQPPAGQPFGMSQPPRQDEQEAEAVEKTVVMQRGPKMKVLGMLIDRKQPTRRFDLNKPTLMIGRARDNDICIEDGTVSRQHAVIKLENGEFRVYDLGSANGTFVGDQRVREPIDLQDGAILRFGEVSFLFKKMSLE